MKKVLILISSLFITFLSYAQLENSNFCFGKFAKMSFNTGSPIASTSANIYTGAGGIGSSSVSDKFGNLLFYTNGYNVWDKNNNVIPNGSGLIGGSSPTYDKQGLLIVPKPNSETIYYIFSVTDLPRAATGNISGCFYTIVDMDPTVNGGNGFINPSLKNIPLKNHLGIPIQFNYTTQIGIRNFEQRITSTLNNTGDKIWVSLFAFFEGSPQIERYAFQFLVSSSGINNTPDGQSPNPTTYNVLDNNNFGNFGSSGHIKFSPNSSFLCDAHTTAVTLYNFNNTTGNLSFNRNIFSLNAPNPGLITPGYGLEFSPNSNLIYFSSWFTQMYQEKNILTGTVQKTFKQIKQYNINGKKSDSAITIASIEVPNQPQNLQPIPVTYQPFDLQLATNNLIYVAHDVGWTPSTNFLGAITNPNQQGIGCNYVNNVVSLLNGTETHGNLPQWVHKAIPIVIPPTGTWPKVYDALYPVTFKKDNSDNLLLSISNLRPITTPINHNGPFPNSINENQVIFHYNLNAVTNWFKLNKDVSNTLNNGVTQLYETVGNPPNSFINEYIDGTSGINVNGPTLPIDEKLLLEINPDIFITRDINFNHFLHNSLFTNPITNISNHTKFIFNKNTNMLYVFLSQYFTLNSTLKVYQFNNNSFTLISSNTFVVPTETELLQVDDMGNVYLIYDNKLQIFDHVNNIFTPITMPGFSNNDLDGLESDNYNTENRALLFNKLENRIYMVDFSTFSYKKINVQNFSSNNRFLLRYIFKDNFVYMTGLLKGFSPTIIGNQTLPVIGSSLQSVFVTKFDLNTDFNFTSLQEAAKPSPFEISLSPNPTTNLIKVNSTTNPSNVSYSVLITNQFGITKFKKQNYVLNSNLDISTLQKGVYFVELINSKGEKSGKSFIKL